MATKRPDNAGWAGVARSDMAWPSPVRPGTRLGSRGELWEGRQGRDRRRLAWPGAEWRVKAGGWLGKSGRGWLLVERAQSCAGKGLVIMANAKQQSNEIEILTVNQGRLDVFVLGTTPIILNRMSQKALHEILLPKGRKTQADKAANLKHDPFSEFRASPYTDKIPDAPTLIQHLSSAFKNALASAALDLPGANKSQIARLTWVNGERVSVYGIPKLSMMVVRSADMNRTPDVRSRAIIPQWACKFTVSYVTPLLKPQTVASLLASAGITQGVGDYRPGKGKGTYGQFELVNENDPRWMEIVKTGGRKAQMKAMDNPEPYDDETEEMLEWFTAEVGARGWSRNEDGQLIATGTTPARTGGRMNGKTSKIVKDAPLDTQVEG